MSGHANPPFPDLDLEILSFPLQQDRAGFISLMIAQAGVCFLYSWHYRPEHLQPRAT
jgi:hypothetical protein